MAGIYVAMGDSVAAGIGLNTPSDSSACERYNESYPYVLAQSKRLTLTNISCSGATIESGIVGAQTVNKLTLQSQLAQLQSLPKPDVISLQLGANDTKLLPTLGQCYIADCSESQLDVRFSGLLRNFESELHATLKQLNTIYDRDTPAIILGGYYNLFSKDAKKCNDTQGITDNEIDLGAKYVSQLNAVLKNAKKKYSNVRYVEPNFDGHELCTEDPYVQGQNDARPFHPTIEGQKVYADAVSKLLDTTGASQ